MTRYSGERLPVSTKREMEDVQITSREATTMMLLAVVELRDSLSASGCD